MGVMPSPSDQLALGKSLTSTDPASRFHTVGASTSHPLFVHHKLALPSSPPSSTPKLAIVLLHGFLSTLNTFDAMIQPLADATSLPCLSFDRVAFGLTQRPEPFAGGAGADYEDAPWVDETLQRDKRSRSPYSNESAVTLLGALAKDVLPSSVKELILVGSSAGATVSLEAALAWNGRDDAPFEVAAVALVGCPHVGPPRIALAAAGSWFMRAMLRPIMKWGMPMNLPLATAYRDLKALEHTRPELLTRAYRVPITHIPNLIDGVLALSAHMRPLDLLDPTIISQLAPLPLAILHGTRDGVVAPGEAVQGFKRIAAAKGCDIDTVERCAARVVARETAGWTEGGKLEEKGLRWAMIEDVGHLPMEEDPEIVVNVVAEFVGFLKG